MELETLSTSSLLVNKPCSVLGDFNQTLTLHEHSSPNSLNIDKQMRKFGQSLLHAELGDLNFRGTTFTWWNKQKSKLVAKKLDRVLVNDKWLECFPTSLARFQDPDFSDHSYSIVSLQPNSPRKKRPFKFFNFLLQNPDFIASITEEWFSINVRGSAMYRLAEKLRILKKCIREFSKDNYLDLEKRVAEAHQDLLLRQKKMLQQPTTINAEMEMWAQLKWQELACAEQSFLLH